MNVVQAISNRHPVSCYLGKCRHTTDMCPPLHNPECFVFFITPMQNAYEKKVGITYQSLFYYIYIFVYIYSFSVAETTLSLAPFGPLSIPLSFYSFRQC